jgi:beta-mannanase
MAFYPGGDVVDYVGLTVLGDAEWDWDMGYQAPRSLAEILAPRYAEVSATGKPVLLAEVGTSGSPETQQAWLADGISSLSAFQQVRGVVYFDDRNAPNNHRETEPDWRLGADGLSALTELAQAPSITHAAASGNS